MYTIIILLFLWAYVVGSMARPEPAGSSRAGPGHQIWNCFAGWAGAGPHNSICGPGPGRVCTSAAGPGRACASNHICEKGMGLDFRPMQGPNMWRHRPVTRRILEGPSIQSTSSVPQTNKERIIMWHSAYNPQWTVFRRITGSGAECGGSAGKVY